MNLFRVYINSDIQRAPKTSSSQHNPDQSQLLERLKDKPFWLWDPTSHKQADRVNKGDCCFNHIIGLPTKGRVRKPLFDYERILYDALLRPGYLNSKPATKEIGRDNIAHPFKAKHVWVKKLLV